MRSLQKCACFYSPVSNDFNLAKSYASSVIFKPTRTTDQTERRAFDAGESAVRMAGKPRGCESDVG